MVMILGKTGAFLQSGGDHACLTGAGLDLSRSSRDGRLARRWCGRGPRSGLGPRVHGAPVTLNEGVRDQGHRSWIRWSWWLASSTRRWMTAHSWFAAAPGEKLAGARQRRRFRRHGAPFATQIGQRKRRTAQSSPGGCGWWWDTVGVLDRQPTKGSTRSRWMWPRRDR
jgi:hypothetical protein